MSVAKPVGMIGFGFGESEAILALPGLVNEVTVCELENGAFLNDLPMNSMVIFAKCKRLPEGKPYGYESRSWYIKVHHIVMAYGNFIPPVI